MNWEAIGAIGELLGSLAVLVTLIYLALQIRQSKKLLEENQRIALSQTYQSRAGFRMETFKFGLEPHGANLIAKFDTSGRSGEKMDNRLENFETLSPHEKVQIRSYYSLSLQAMDNTLYQGELGLLDDVQQQNAKEAIVLNYPIWEYVGAVIPPSVKKWHEQNVSPSGET